MTIETNPTKLDHFVYYPVTIHFRTSYIIYDICTTRSRSSLLLKIHHGDRKIQSATVPPGCGGIALVHRDTPASIESGSRPSFARSDRCRNREPSDFQSVLATPEPEGQNGKDTGSCSSHIFSPRCDPLPWEHTCQMRSWHTVLAKMQ